MKNITGPGTYQLNETTSIYPSASASYAYYAKRKINPLNDWMTSTHYTGTVTITKWDMSNMIVSGTFEFNVGTIGGSGEAISVTEGRFDVKLQ